MDKLEGTLGLVIDVPAYSGGHAVARASAAREIVLDYVRLALEGSKIDLERINSTGESDEVRGGRGAVSTYRTALFLSLKLQAPSVAKGKDRIETIIPNVEALAGTCLSDLGIRLVAVKLRGLTRVWSPPIK